MTIIGGGIKWECKLTLRHINRIAKAMNSRGQLRDVVQVIGKYVLWSLLDYDIARLLFGLFRASALSLIPIT